MRSNRRKNWFIKRFALGLAIAAIAAPVAQAKVDEGSSVQANGYLAFATDFPSPQVNASDYGMPRAMPVDYAVNRGDQIEVVRALPSGSPTDKIEFVRTQPRSVSEPQLASRFGQPNATTGDELASWNVDWTDAGVGAGLAVALVLLGLGAALASRHVGRAQTA